MPEVVDNSEQLMCEINQNQTGKTIETWTLGGILASFQNGTVGTAVMWKALQNSEKNKLKFESWSTKLEQNVHSNRSKLSVY